MARSITKAEARLVLQGLIDEEKSRMNMCDWRLRHKVLTKEEYEAAFNKSLVVIQVLTLCVEHHR